MSLELPEAFESMSAIAVSLDQITHLDAPSTYLVRCEGDSMIGAGIYSGDLLVVSKSAEAVAGSIVIGVIDGLATCKRLEYVHGQAVLRAANRGFPDRFVLEHETLDIWGVVTHSVRAHL